jgi:glutathione peroxidase
MRFALLLACSLFAASFTAHAEDKVKSPLDFSLESIDGKPYALNQHKGQVVMIVNVASKCGLTPQYKALEEVYAKYKDKGLTIIGVPANEFGAQEPGTNAEIKEFCSTKYNVTFPMMSKVVVKGDGICPLYDYLTNKSPKPGPIAWNFAKFLVDRQGNVIDRFDPKVPPSDPKVTEAIEKALAAK